MDKAAQTPGLPPVEEPEFDITPFLLQDGDTERAYRPMFQPPIPGQPNNRLFPAPRAFRSSIIDGLNMQPFDAQRTSAMTNVLDATNRRAARIQQGMAPSRFPPSLRSMPGGGSFAPGSVPTFVPKMPPKDPNAWRKSKIRLPEVDDAIKDLRMPAGSAFPQPQPKNLNLGGAPTIAAAKTAAGPLLKPTAKPLGAANKIRMGAGDVLGTVYNQNDYSSLVRRIARKRPAAQLNVEPMPRGGTFAPGTGLKPETPPPLPKPPPIPTGAELLAKAASWLDTQETGQILTLLTKTGSNPSTQQARMSGDGPAPPRTTLPYSEQGEAAIADVRKRFQRKKLLS